MNTHTGVKPFSCTVCSKNFHSRYYKSKNEKVCTGETRTTCETCGKSLCDTSSLSRHRITQHQGRQFTGVGRDYDTKVLLSGTKRIRNTESLTIVIYIFQIILVIEPGVTGQTCTDS